MYYLSQQGNICRRMVKIMDKWTFLQSDRGLLSLRLEDPGYFPGYPGRDAWHDGKGLDVTWEINVSAESLAAERWENERWLPRTPEVSVYLSMFVRYCTAVTFHPDNTTALLIEETRLVRLVWLAGPQKLSSKVQTIRLSKSETSRRKVSYEWKR